MGLLTYLSVASWTGFRDGIVGVRESHAWTWHFIIFGAPNIFEYLPWGKYISNIKNSEFQCWRIVFWVSFCVKQKVLDCSEAGGISGRRMRWYMSWYSKKFKIIFWWLIELSYIEITWTPMLAPMSKYTRQHGSPSQSKSSGLDRYAVASLQQLRGASVGWGYSVENSCPRQVTAIKKAARLKTNLNAWCCLTRLCGVYARISSGYPLRLSLLLSGKEAGADPHSIIFEIRTPAWP